MNLFIVENYTAPLFKRKKNTFVSCPPCEETSFQHFIKVWDTTIAETHMVVVRVRGSSNAKYLNNIIREKLRSSV